MFKFIRIGKLLEQGVMQYQQRDFIKASHVFEQALAINEQDFTANFWMARTLTMLGDYEGVKALLNKCRELGPQVIELLIVPLEDLIQELENGDRLSSELIVQYNSATDNSLHQCYFKKFYALDEVISVTLIAQLLLLPIFIIAPVCRLPGLIIWNYLMMSIILYYFHYSTLLPLNLWLRYQWVKEQMNCLARDLSFRQLTVRFLIGAGVYYFGLNLLSPQLTVQSFKNPVDIQIVLWSWLAGPAAPPDEELVWRLAWYNYLAKYDKYYACVGVSLLFM